MEERECIMIRTLKLSDLDNMYEWMQDVEVTKNLQAPFASFTREKVKNFIEDSMTQTTESENLNFAIVDEADEYMGTISLKNIDRKCKNAEYAIVTRAKAHGRGYAMEATKDIIQYGFETLGLEKIYLYVSVDNIRANKFYEKAGFVEEGVFRRHLMIGGELTDIRWYAMLRDEWSKG